MNSQQPVSRYLTVTYDPPGYGSAESIRSTLIPLTNDYNVALDSAKSAFQRYFPSGSTNRRRWLSKKVELSTGSSWAEVMPETFPLIVGETGVEFRLCEDHRLVNILPLENDASSSYQFKVIAVGNMSVGKSMMIQYFTKPYLARQEAPVSTVGVRNDVSSRFCTAQGARLKIELWDTAGQERYRSMVRSHYRGANGVFLVYSVTDRDSFIECESWLNELKDKIDEHAPIMLVGNQVDLALSRVVETSEGSAFALDNGLLFAEMSAKEGDGVESAFQVLVNEAFSRLRERNRLPEYETARRDQRLQLTPNDNRPWYRYQFTCYC